MAVWMPKRTQTGLCFHPRNLEIMEAGRPPGSSVAAGSLTGLCQTSPVIGFLVPPLRPQHPGIYLVLFLDTMNAPPFPFFGFFTLRGGRLGNSPPQHTVVCSGGRGRTSATGRATVPLPPHPWLVASQPSSCQGIQFHAFVYGAGGGTTSLAPHLRLEAKVAPPMGHVSG